MPEFARTILAALFAVDSVWSVVVRGAIWLGVAMVIIISTDASDPDRSMRSLKSNLGFFLLFLVVSGTLFWLLFSYTKA